MSNCSWVSPGSRTILAKSPCLNAFWEERCFPSSVLGPVLRGLLISCTTLGFSIIKFLKAQGKEAAASRPGQTTENDGPPHGGPVFATADSGIAGECSS